jgi:hypothetical protein
MKITPPADAGGGLDAKKCWRGCPVTPPFAHAFDDPPNANIVPFGPPLLLRIAGVDNKKQVDTLAWSGGRTNCRLMPRAVSHRILWSPGSNLSPGASKEAVSFACSTPPHAPLRASRSLGVAIGRERSSWASRKESNGRDDAVPPVPVERGHLDPADATLRVTARPRDPTTGRRLFESRDVRSLGVRSSAAAASRMVLSGFDFSFASTHRVLTLTLTQSVAARRRAEADAQHAAPRTGYATPRAGGRRRGGPRRARRAPPAARGAGAGERWLSGGSAPP